MAVSRVVCEIFNVEKCSIPPSFRNISEPCRDHRRHHLCHTHIMRVVVDVGLMCRLFQQFCWRQPVFSSVCVQSPDILFCVFLLRGFHLFCLLNINFQYPVFSSGVREIQVVCQYYFHQLFLCTNSIHILIWDVHSIFLSLTFRKHISMAFNV